MGKFKSLILLLILTGCATQKVTEVKAPKEESLRSVTKRVDSDSITLDHGFFKISYNPKKRLANFVTYELSAENLRKGNGERKNKFIADPLLKEKNLPYVEPREYTKTGYDRGHLAPSADFSWSQEANDMTFVMSNVAPQKPKLNRDAWRRLEAQVRRWACGEEKILVITGPVMKESGVSLPSGLMVPEAFFKVVIDETPPKKAIAFLYYQEDRGDLLLERTLPLKKLESLSGLAFSREFPELEGGKMRMPAGTNEWKEAECIKEEEE